VSGSLRAELRRLSQVGDHAAVELRAQALSGAELASSDAVLELVYSRMRRGHLKTANELCDAVVLTAASPALVLEARLRQAVLKIHLTGQFGASRQAADEIEEATASDPQLRSLNAKARMASCQIVAMERVYLLRSDSEFHAASARLDDIARIFEDLGELDDAAIAWLSVGHYRQLGAAPDLDGARSALCHAVERARSWQLPEREGEALANLGDLLYRDSETRSEGLSCFESARKIFAHTGHRHGCWDVERLLANQRIRFGEDATEELRRCMHAYAEQDHLRWLESVLTSLATWNLRCGRTQEARLYSEEATRISRRMGSILAKVASSLTVADFWARKGEYSRAIHEYEALLETGLPDLFANQIKMLLGNAFLTARDLVAAERLFMQVCDDALRMDDLTSASLAAVNLSNTYHSAENLDQARAVLEEWIPRDVARGAVVEAAQKYVMLADIEVHNHRRQDPNGAVPWPEPEQHYRSALHLLEPLAEPEARAQVAQTIQSLANFHLLRGELEPALEHIERAIASYRDLGYGIQAANSVFLKGLIHYELAVRRGVVASFAQAEAALSESLTFYLQAGIHAQAQQARYIFAQLVARASPFAASEEGRQKIVGLAWDLLEAYEADDMNARLSLVLRDALSMQEARLNLRANDDFYRFAIDATAILARDTERSLQWLERQKSRVFVEILAHTPLNRVDSALAAPFLEREATLQSRIRVAAGDREAAALTTELQALYDATEAQNGDNEYLHLRRGRPLSLSQIRGLLATGPPTADDVPRRVILAEFFLREHDVWIFLIDPLRKTTERFEVEIPRACLSRFVEMAFEDDLGPRTSLNESTPAHLHQFDALAAPLAEHTRPGDLLCLIPYGELHFLPFHALRVDGEPLVARNPIVYAPSATVLGFCQSKRKLDATGRPQMATAAVFGDPTDDMPRNRDCARLVADLFGTSPTLGTDVTTAAFESAIRGADVIHFQGHAEFDAAEPLSSYLRMAGGEVITARRIFGLAGLDAHLVSLGACRTGFNKVRRGDELLGLVRAFLYAGTPSVLATLWPVQLESTTFFMERFYTHLRNPKKPSTKIDALRSAMLETRAHRPEWDAVYHWAPFLLIGDWL
jgi:CHAT domain-containing protein